MGFLSRVLRLGKAQGDAVLTGLEAGKEVKLTDVDIREAEADERRVMSSLGQVRATVAGIQRQIADLTVEQSKYEERAIALAEKGEQSLAERNALESQRAEEQCAQQKSMLVTQEDMDATLRTRLNQIQDRIRQAKNDRQLIASMDSVVKATATARSSLANGDSTALDRIRDRKARLRQKMDVASAVNSLVEDSSGDSLETASKAALGETGGSAALQALISKKK